ncbi:hypothetical protein [Fictibacillus fluitans]|uniref:Phage protein n=1 Tax=Fictibacillus fluitans TaxID=3058422 RepID=A0ABT8HXY4_9BACL|nr:hypothetical protein [Fictibacillus sp. NE201]MDN4525335.1 hypothetical protein [Fictibacillus sp. NE201]
MKLYDRLSAEQKRKLNNIKRPDKKKRKKKNKGFSERDLKDLMGVNRDTYKRVNGAIRKK